MFHACVPFLSAPLPFAMSVSQSADVLFLVGVFLRSVPSLSSLCPLSSVLSPLPLCLSLVPPGNKQTLGAVAVGRCARQRPPMLCTFWRCLRSRLGQAAAFKTALFRCCVFAVSAVELSQSSPHSSSLCFILRWIRLAGPLHYGRLFCVCFVL